MINENAAVVVSSSNNNMDNSVVILHNQQQQQQQQQKGRPRSATIGGEAALCLKTFTRATIAEVPHIANPRRTLRRCASTPDLMMGDSAHEVIVEDESDTEEDDSSGSDDVELIEGEESVDLEESFEVLSDKNQEAAEGEDEPVMIDEDSNASCDDTGGEEESATLVSAPSVGTSSWTMASSTIPSPSKPTTSVWGMKKTLSFKDMLAKNIDDAAGSGEFGKDKVMTEAKLRDSHRRHHLRVRTKPKFVVADDAPDGNQKKMMKHAHSTGDLTKILSAVEEGHESSFGNGRRNRRVKKQLSAMMEEDDEEGDFIIGRGSGHNGGSSSGGGGGGGGGGEVFGDTDAMDYYQRKDHGMRSTSNKKKERPDEAKRREIIMHKKDMQRKKQALAEKQKGSGGNDKSPTKSGKKKKNDKGFGGKKERRRL